MFEKTFKGFFEDHRKYLSSHLPESCNSADSVLPTNLYQPVAYRVFGKFRLAIISLIDDFAFGNRIFNPSHLSSRLDNEESKGWLKDLVMMGTCEDEDNDYLKKKALSTFHCGRNRYPLLGIIRLKVDYRVLYGKGYSVIREAKERIASLQNCLNTDKKIDVLIMDNYDCDEMVVLVFSQSIENLYHFYSSVRRIEYTIKNPATTFIKHLFSSCHITVGVDADYDLIGKDNERFLPISFEPKYHINCLFETKPGHRKEFYSVLKGMFQQSNRDSIKQEDPQSINTLIERTISGGSIVIAKIHFDQLQDLITQTKNKRFRENIRRIRLTLNDPTPIPDIEPTGKEHFSSHEEKTITPTEKKEFRILLIKLGVAKTIRERLLSLIDLYNDCVSNHLQTSYFEDLIGPVRALKRVLYEFLAGNESIPDIEEKLDQETSSLKNSFYNRVHNKQMPNTVLEYSGGVQQYLQAVGFAYRQMVSILYPSEQEAQYTSITGTELVSSTRTRFELNINHLIYPQLFAVIAWKEASNYANVIMADVQKSQRIRQEEIAPTEAIISKIKSYSSFISEQEGIFIHRQLLRNSRISEMDDVEKWINYWIKANIIKYSLSDYVVFHFAFGRDFRMMWEFYWQLFLQTTSNYYRRNVVRRKMFIMVLMRLFMVGFRDKGNNGQSKWLSFINKQGKLPFDIQLSSVWVECYSRVLDAVKEIMSIMEHYDISEVSDWIVLIAESKVSNDFSSKWSNKGGNNYAKELAGTLSYRVNNRNNHIQRIIELFKSGISITEEDFPREMSSSEKVICLLQSYLKAVHELQVRPDSDNVLKSVPLDYYPMVSPEKKDHDHDTNTLKDFFDQSRRILADPSGGFFIPEPNVRGQYLLYNTILYRALWDMSYRCKTPMFQEAV